MFMGVPIAFGLAISGFVGYWVLEGSLPAITVMGVVPYGSIATYSFTVIPLFLLMGNIAYHGGLGADIFKAARYTVGRIPGGLAQATVMGCTAFGAACGSGLAACAMMSKLAIPEMMKYGYDRKLAYGTVAAAGPIAAMIPPSVLMVIYGIITDTSVGKLLIGGIIPGLIAAANFMIYIYIVARRNPTMAPLLKPVSSRDTLIAIKGGWTIGLLALVIMGGIYSGVFTPTEAAGVGAFTSIVLSLAMKRLNLKHLRDSILDTMKVNGMIFLIMVGAFIFGTFLAVSQVPFILSQFLTSLEVPRLLILLAIMVFYIILGCLIDMLAGMFLTLPIIFPCIVTLGYDPIWFGILMVHLTEIALLTPPYGLNLFIIKGVIPEAKLGEVIAGVFPFILVDVVTLAIYIAFPQVVLFLPNMMG